ncbi:MAG: homoserine dehydrogenase [Betaproteobacteria bacterium]|nr:homoserine dehydrogenase [Betaproteobacteria bacterium]
MKKSDSLFVAVAGAGTVGGEVLRLLHQNADLIAARCGRRAEVCAVGVRNAEKARAQFPEYADLVVQGWEKAAKHPKAEIVLELMGGETEARACIQTALADGKAVVTANKALLAADGGAVFAAANAAKKPVAFEAAVAGCIPIVKILRESLAADKITEITGIINGTCNYITSAMDRGMAFCDALADAQKLGYAEADPSLDIDGDDAAHKIALISRLAFNARPAIGSFPVEGVRGFNLADIKYAAQFNFSIKLLANAHYDGRRVSLSVRPTLVSKKHPISAVDNSMNAVLVKSVFSGETMYYGAGAGGAPTAVAVVGDLIDIARKNCALFMPSDSAPPPITPAAKLRAPYFMRLRVLDRPGVLAKITGILAAENISIEAMHQNEAAPGCKVDIIILLHETARGYLDAAVHKIEQSDAVFGAAAVFPIRRFGRQ